MRMTPLLVLQIHQNEVWSDGGYVRCPWCGHNGPAESDMHTRAWEYQAEFELECETCEKPFTVRQVVTVDYASSRKEGEDG